ncbi:MAG: PAS domain-containing sensor histidine kinase [Desulfuromonadales bacterium]|nr:PAS domain-containing sensor histidine kinase [Desulfuromonadales bacterium]
MQSITHPHMSIEDFFLLACENQSVPILLIEPSTGSILKSNAEAEKLYGYRRSALETMRISDIILATASHLPTGTIPPQIDLEKKQTSLHRRADNTLLTVAIHPSRLSLAGSDLFFCVLHDITERIRHQQEREYLEKAREQLEIIVEERTRQLNETMELLRHETHKRQLIENNVTILRENLEIQERTRVARDIHDGIGQTLQAIKLQLKMRQARCKEGEACNGFALNDVIREITSASTELREIILALRPLFLEETNLDVAVRSLCERTAKRTNLNVRAECHGTFRGLGSSFKLSIFRICQEALANIVKHSRSSSAMIRLERDLHRLRIVIRDDGIGGVACPTIISQQGSGLTIMRERVELLNGSFTVISPPGMGTVITVEAPLT